MAEDDPAVRRVVETYLRKWGYEPLPVSDGAQAWRVLESSRAPRMALLDWMMPGLEGIDVCRKVREAASRPYTYILMLTAASRKKQLVAALHAGADDYLVKPFDAEELRARLYAGRRILAAQDQLISAREELRFRATHDSLTGLWNHGELLRILGQEMMRAARARVSLGLLMIDLDHFKQINDLYGHLVGDEVLAEVSSRLQASVRAYDVVGRCGGEEFIVVVPNVEEQGARALARRILARLRERPFETSAGPIQVTASLGVAISPSAAPLEPVNLIRAADSALYRAKRNGRNRAEIGSGAESQEEPPAPAIGTSS